MPFDASNILHLKGDIQGIKRLQAFIDDCNKGFDMTNALKISKMRKIDILMKTATEKRRKRSTKNSPKKLKKVHGMTCQVTN